MTADKQADAKPEERPKFIWRSNLAVWVVLMALVMLTLGLAYLPLGYLNLPVALSIAAAKTLLIAIFFMELRLAKELHPPRRRHRLCLDRDHVRFDVQRSGLAGGLRSGVCSEAAAGRARRNCPWKG